MLSAVLWSGSSLPRVTSWWGKAQLRERLCLLSPSTLLLLGNWLLTSTTSHSRQVAADQGASKSQLSSAV